MLFKNAKYPDANFVMQTGDIEFEDGKIVAVGENLPYSPQDMVVDCAGYSIIPSFMDVHIHGSNMADCSDGDVQGILDMANFLLSEGVTYFCPTIMTISKEAIIKAVNAVEEAIKIQTEGAKIVGIHLEGPFISVEKKGAQKEENILLPDFELFKELFEMSEIKLVTIAPELPNAMEFIEKASKLCTVSLGHTTADYQTCEKAFAKGASQATHLFNAMPGLHHREPSLIGAFMANDVMAEIICDGKHINKNLVKSMFTAFSDKLIVVSDSTRLCGMEEGTIGTLGDQEIVLKNGLAYLQNGTIAGSALSLHKAFLNLVSWGVPMGKAVKSLSYNPAKTLGMEDKMGSIEVGKEANLLVLDENLNIVAVEFKL